MSPLPEFLVDRWADRVDQAPGEGVVYWHLLLGGYAEVRDVAALARGRLADFTGLHFTPDTWLHATTLVAGPRTEFSDARLADMAGEVQEALSGLPAPTVELRRVLYHPEAIMLGIQPAQALEPVRSAVVRATAVGVDTPRWVPHTTIAYSTARQPAAPIISALGLEVPPRTVDIDAVSLVVQWGPERDWDWEIVSTVKLGT